MDYHCKVEYFLRQEVPCLKCCSASPLATSTVGLDAAAEECMLPAARLEQALGTCLVPLPGSRAHTSHGTTMGTTLIQLGNHPSCIWKKSVFWVIVHDR